MNVSPLLLTLSDFPLTISMNHSDKNRDGKDLLEYPVHLPVSIGISLTISI